MTVAPNPAAMRGVLSLDPSSMTTRLYLVDLSSATTRAIPPASLKAGQTTHTDSI
jgi:hypothetical protein